MVRSATAPGIPPPPNQFFYGILIQKVRVRMQMQATEFATEKCCTILCSTLYLKHAGTVI